MSSDSDITPPVTSESPEQPLSADRDVPCKLKISFLDEVYFFLFGTSVLLPYNTLINGLDLYEETYPNDSATVNIPRVYNIVESVVFFITLPFVDKFHVIHRMNFSEFGLMLVMILLTILSSIKTNFYVFLIVPGLIGVVTSVFFGSFIGYASLFSPNCVSVGSTGLAFCGVITSIIRLLTKTMDSHQREVYFSANTGVYFILLVVWFLFQRGELSKEATKNISTNDDFCWRVKHASDSFRKIWVHALGGTLCFLITLAVFPGYITTVKSKHGLDIDWIIIIVTTVFQAGDFIGRLITRWVQIPSPKYLWIAQVVRLLFFPLFILSIQDILFGDDIFVYVLTFLLAFTNGSCMSLCLIYTSADPTLNGDEVEIASFLSSFFCSLGIFLGSWITLAFQTLN